MAASLDLQAPLQDSGFRDRRLNRKSDAWESASTVTPRTPQVMAQGRMHHLMRQRARQRGRGQRFDEFRIPEKRNTIGGHRFDGATFPILQPIQKRAEERMVEK